MERDEEDDDNNIIDDVERGIKNEIIYMIMMM